MTKKFGFVTAIFVFSFSWMIHIPTSTVYAEESIGPLIISELKVRNDTAGYDEFIEIFNASTQPVELSRYRIEYFNTPTGQARTAHSVIDSGILAAGEYFVLAKNTSQILHAKQSPFSSLLDSGGQIQIVEITSGLVIDKIAWTSTAGQATSGIVLVSVSSSDKSITTTINEHDSLQRLLAVPSPQSSVLLPGASTPENPEGSHPMSNGVTCEGIVISEILPNPAGADAGKEFIELYNPTDEVISLQNCFLKTSANSKEFTLPDIEMQPGEYKAFYDNQSGLTLPNSSGGTVWLLSATTELDAVVHPENIPDDVAWAFLDNAWQPTYAPTPNGSNISMPLKPCPAAQERSAETNQCRKIAGAASASLVPCKVGQERNPETNRCRNISSAQSNLVPCKPGQERNPETNRCRNTAKASSLAACAPGQERNPQTNRCRKIVGVAGTSKGQSAQDVYSPIVQNKLRWFIAGSIALAAIGYSMYEWRREITTFSAGLRHRYLKPRRQDKSS